MSKGVIFRGTLGFNEQTLGPALKEHLMENFGKAVIQDEGRISVVGQMTGANGRTAVVKSVWQMINDGHSVIYRLITAYPK